MSDQPFAATIRFAVTCAASPALPLRVLNLLAQRDLPFGRVEIERDAGLYRIAIDQPALPIEHARIIVEKMRMIAMVHEAEMRVLDRPALAVQLSAAA